MGSGAKSYMGKGFLIYEEMRKVFPIYEEAVSHTLYEFAPDPSAIPYIWRNSIFFVISVIASKPTACWYYLALANIGKSSKCHTKRRRKWLLRTLLIEVQIRPVHYASSICFTLHYILLIETIKGLDFKKFDRNGQI